MFYGIHMKAISQEILIIEICKMCLKMIIDVIAAPPRANALITYQRQGQKHRWPQSWVKL